jgi:hypothetical protein
MDDDNAETVNEPEIDDFAQAAEEEDSQDNP